MTIRAKLYVAILLTVIGPVITIAVALHGMDRLGDRFDEVQDRSDQRALALDLKFGVTDFNGWQTAYGYDDGASRPRFEHSVRQFRIDLGAARNELTDRREARLLDEIGTRFQQFMALDRHAYAALRQRRRRAREADLPRAGAAPLRRDGEPLGRAGPLRGAERHGHRGGFQQLARGLAARSDRRGAGRRDS